MRYLRRILETLRYLLGRRKPTAHAEHAHGCFKLHLRFRYVRTDIYAKIQGCLSAEHQTTHSKRDFEGHANSVGWSESYFDLFHFESLTASSPKRYGPLVPELAGGNT